eukprot:GEMP01063201.1.p1 GENE.GEMP01063201.1~~GEMP01063201.1.p1  ORF type:complete len:184 (+),score=30.42 GEMP01063201.1:122-673(+)
MATSPAPDIFGAMDGETVPLGKFQEVQKFIDPLKAQYTKYVQVKPWKEFIKIEMEVPKKENVVPYLNQNMRLYKGNYLCVTTAILLLTIVSSPWCLFVVALLAGGWVGFLRKNEDENWQVNIGGVVMSKMHRLYAMLLLTALIVIMFLGSVIGSVIFCGGLFVLGHGVLHKPTEVLSVDEDII